MIVESGKAKRFFGEKGIGRNARVFTTSRI
jgi:hypothetical protein